MDREIFAARFRDAATTVRDFARQFIQEDLPDRMLFRVRLNASYDGNPLHKNERVYPEDSSLARTNSLRECEEEVVLSTLWREERVPEWVDMQVSGLHDDATLIEVLSCGRFTADEGLLYHEREGRPPFHVVGPRLPIGYQDGQRFSIYHRAECWSRADFDHLLRYRDRVWSLNFWGESFDDVVMGQLPAFPALEILDLHRTRTEGAGLAGLDRHPRLRVLRFHLPGGRPFNLNSLPMIPGLEAVGVENLGADPWGFDCLAIRAPRLDWLTLQGSGRIITTGPFPSALSWLTITAKSVSDDTVMPRRIEHLSLHLSGSSPEDVERLLVPVEHLETLGLSGTPVDDALIRRLLARFQLKHLDVVDTALDADAVRRIAIEHPALRLLPNLAKATDAKPRSS